MSNLKSYSICLFSLKSVFLKLLIPSFMLMSQLSSGQLKVTNNGRVAIGQNFANQEFKFTVNSGEICALNLISNSRTKWSWASISQVGIDQSKSWIVSQNGNHKMWVYGDGQVWCKSTNKTSDSSIKTNISPILDYARIIENLHGNYYYYKEFDGCTDSVNTDGTIFKKRNAGFIAQQVLPIFPEAVYFSPSENLYSVDYTTIIPVLVEYIKFLKLRTDSIANRINICCPEIINSQPNLNIGNEDIDVGGKNFNIYPNPNNSGKLFIEANDQNQKYNSVLITDINGKLLTEISLPNKHSGNYEYSIPDNIKNQVVVVNLLFNSNFIFSKKILIQNH